MKHLALPLLLALTGTTACDGKLALHIPSDDSASTGAGGQGVAAGGSADANATASGGTSVSGSTEVITGQVSISATDNQQATIGGCTIKIVDKVPQTSGSCDGCKVTNDAAGGVTLICSSSSTNDGTAGGVTGMPGNGNTSTNTGGGSMTGSSTITLADGSTVTIGTCKVTVSGGKAQKSGNCDGCDLTDNGNGTATLKCSTSQPDPTAPGPTPPSTPSPGGGGTTTSSGSSSVPLAEGNTATVGGCSATARSGRAELTGSCQGCTTSTSSNVLTLTCTSSS